MFTKTGRILFNDNWQFLMKDTDVPFSAVENSPEEDWLNIEVPHDWTVWGGSGVLGATDDSGARYGWYKKEFKLPSSKQVKEKSFELTFDGVFGDCKVYINGSSAFECKAGSTGFSFEIGHMLKKGVNTVHVGVSAVTEADGAGLCRNIWLTEQAKTHIISDGVYIVIRFKTDVWKMRVGVGYEGDVDFIRYTVTDPDGNDVITAESSRDYIFEFENPKVWSLASPSLYTLKTQLIGEDKILDEVVSVFGFRTVNYSYVDGFIFNEQRIRLCGVRLNTGYGALGNAFNVSAARIRLQRLKDMGVNVIDLPHSHYAPELIELCDKAGLLVVSDVDAPQDDFYKIRRDRNHPSVSVKSSSLVPALKKEYFIDIEEHDPYLNAVSVIDTRFVREFPLYSDLFDSAGFPALEYYYYKAVWSGSGVKSDSEPFVKLFPHWDWNIGQKVNIMAYSDMQKVELFLNGESKGRQFNDLASDGVQSLNWEIEYECGDLTAKAYDFDDDIAAVDRLSSFWDAAVLIAEYSDDAESPLRANGRDVKYITIRACDDSGEFVMNANNRVTVEVTGAARLVGFDNGDPLDRESFKSDNRRLYGGQASAIIQTGLAPGKALVEICSRGLRETRFEFDIVPAEPHELVGVSVADVIRDEQDYNFDDEVLTRKIELNADRVALNKSNPTAKIKAEIYPADSDYTALDWIYVCYDSSGEEIDEDDAEDMIEIESSGIWCRVTAKAECRFRVCACCRGGGTAQVVSEIEMTMSNN